MKIKRGENWLEIQILSRQWSFGNWCFEGRALFTWLFDNCIPTGAEWKKEVLVCIGAVCRRSRQIFGMRSSKIKLKLPDQSILFRLLFTCKKSSVEILGMTQADSHFHSSCPLVVTLLLKIKANPKQKQQPFSLYTRCSRVA